MAAQSLSSLLGLHGWNAQTLTPPSPQLPPPNPAQQNAAMFPAKPTAPAPPVATNYFSHNAAQVSPGIYFTGNPRQDALVSSVFGLNKPAAPTGPTVTAPSGLGIDYGIGDYRNPETQMKAEKAFGKNWRNVLGLTEEQTATPVARTGQLTTPASGAQDTLLKTIFGPDYASILNLNPGTPVAGADTSGLLAQRKLGEKGALQAAIQAENKRRNQLSFFEKILSLTPGLNLLNKKTSNLRNLILPGVQTAKGS